MKDHQLECQKRLREHSSMKAIQILSAISYGDRYSTITEICAVTGLSVSTVHRILQELVECDFVVKDETQKRYRAGIEAWSFSMKLKQTDYLREATREEMTRLNDLSRETIHLIAVEGEQGVYVAKLGAKNSIGLQSQVGRRLPLFCSGGGKALLAWQSPQWMETYLKRVPLERFTERTITTQKELLKELEVIRVRGYALDNREHHNDIICVAAPIFDSNGDAVCSIGISAPDYRFSLDEAISYAGEVVKSAKRVTDRLCGVVTG